MQDASGLRGGSCLLTLAVGSIQGSDKSARWLREDSSVVTDQGLVTSRTPADLPEFCEKLCEEILEGVAHAPYV